VAVPTDGARGRRLTTPALQVLAAVLAVAVPHPQGPASGMGGVDISEWRPPPRELQNSLVLPEEIIREVVHEMTDEERRRVVQYAIQAAEAHAQGQQAITIGVGGMRQKLNLVEAHYCARFVRQIYETALGLRRMSWPFCAPNARGMEENLRPHRLSRTGERRPGDVVGMSTDSTGPAGHNGIFVGAEADPKKTMIVHNSSGTRDGWPHVQGTKLSLWLEIRPRVTGIYRPE